MLILRIYPGDAEWVPAYTIESERVCKIVDAIRIINYSTHPLDSLLDEWASGPDHKVTLQPVEDNKLVDLDKWWPDDYYYTQPEKY
jgi:hypothetical protein